MAPSGPSVGECRLYPDSLLEKLRATEFLAWHGEDRVDRFCQILRLFAAEGVEAEADLRAWLLEEAALLLSDAELAEDHAEEVVGAEFAGNFRERFLSQAQFFGEEFQVHSACRRSLQVRARAT